MAKHILSTLLLLVALSACGGGGKSSGGNDGGDPGHPPEISGLVFFPTSAPLGAAGSTATVSATITFHDEDGDLEEVHFKAADGSTISTTLEGIETIIDGYLEGWVEVYTDVLGDFPFEVWVTDTKHNASNILPGIFSVTWPDARDLDLGFGDQGFIFYEPVPHATYDEGRALAIGPDAKMTVAGIEGQHLILMRYNPDASLDQTFGVGGVVRYYGEGNQAAANDLVILPDGKIVVAGFRWYFQREALLLRFDSEGELDPTFGNGGVVAYPVGYDACANAVALQPDGKLVIGGSALAIDGPQSYGLAFLARFLADGSLDASFGAGGEVTLEANEGNDVAIEPEGRILLAGSEAAGAFLSAFDADGAPDPAFGTDGKAVYGAGNAELGRALALGSGGEIYLAGTQGGFIGQIKGFVIRLNQNGARDAAFGSGGIAVVDSPGGLGALALQQDGRIVGTGYGPLVARFNSDGSLDPTYSQNGYGTYGSGSANGVDVAIGEDGKIVVAGYSSLHDNFSTTAVMLMRCLPQMLMP